MEITKYCTRHNVLNIATISSFAGIKGGINRECKDVYFIRCIGYDNAYQEEIARMDRFLADREEKGQGKYIRIHELPKLVDQSDIKTYSEKYNSWMKSQKKEISFDFLQNNEMGKEAFSASLTNISEKLKKASFSVSDSIYKNFIVKIMYWTEWIFQKFGGSWDGHRTNKLVYCGTIKKQEYLFFYLLTLLGTDVLLLSPTGEIEVDTQLLSLSGCIILPKKGVVKLPDYDALKYKDGTQILKEAKNPKRQVEKKAEQEQIHKVDICRPKRNTNKENIGRREMEPEELAKLASSVVMLEVHNKKGEVFATGSGIMVGSRGYILTNNHVAAGGQYYSVRIEAEDQVYQTDEVIKYHTILDLALIRIDRNCKPIPIYKGTKPLVRGQKVVAIGSPLGLFNSVSDGIISGFRNIDDVDMIQFTAPISRGSSGGAVLNLYGEVIGISTAGFDSGQNINLAVDYRYINDFIRGFTG